MKDTLLFILTSIVEYPDSIEVEEKHEGTSTMFIVHAKQEDYGKIIGKSGRIIRAIRDLMKLVASKRGEYVDVVLSEDTDK